MRNLARPIAILAAVVSLAVMFTANERYVYPEAVADLPLLTARHIADPRFSGATFRFEGEVQSVVRLPQGIVILDLYDAGEDVNVGVSVFPSLGSLPVVPSRGAVVRITGGLGMFRGQPQIRPLSAAHVEVLGLP